MTDSLPDCPMHMDNDLASTHRDCRDGKTEKAAVDDELLSEKRQRCSIYSNIALPLESTPRRLRQRMVLRLALYNEIYSTLGRERRFWSAHVGEEQQAGF